MMFYSFIADYQHLNANAAALTAAVPNTAEILALGQEAAPYSDGCPRCFMIPLHEHNLILWGERLVLLILTLLLFALIKVLYVKGCMRQLVYLPPYKHQIIHAIQIRETLLNSIWVLGSLSDYSHGVD